MGGPLRGASALSVFPPHPPRTGIAGLLHTLLALFFKKVHSALRCVCQAVGFSRPADTCARDSSFWLALRGVGSPIVAASWAQRLADVATFMCTCNNYLLCDVTPAPSCQHRFVTFLGSPLVSFGSLLVPFGSFWAPFGLPLAPFGSLWLPLALFGSVLVPFGSLLVPLGFPLLPFWLTCGSLLLPWSPFCLPLAPWWLPGAETCHKQLVEYTLFKLWDTRTRFQLNLKSDTD